MRQPCLSRRNVRGSNSQNVDILLVAPYFGGSHRAWARGYARHSRHSVTFLTLPARFWKWRMHGGAATLARQIDAQAARPDLLLATDMLNLPAFLGLTRRHLARVPVALYFHENQLTYPLQAGEKRDLTYGMINWLSMLAADRVLFNSKFHRDDWFEELPRMLKHFPDCSHVPMVPEVQSRAKVLPVGCNLYAHDEARDEASTGAPLILWNQRWEYDKDPQTFFRALDVLVKRDIPFRVALAGSNVRQQPEEFEAARARLGDRVIHYGRADRQTYQRLLWESDVVVSTARHEFFGIAVVEAVYCRCFPVLPCRLAYPEVIPQAQHDRCLYDDFDGLIEHLTWALTHPKPRDRIASTLRSSVAPLDWSQMAPQYDELMDTIIAPLS